jgi:uncharacterized coiled-coil protein SlyX
MDVERIQKINSLAVDLMRQGLAKDREDAVAQAEKIFVSKDSDGYNSIKKNMSSVGNVAANSAPSANNSNNNVNDQNSSEEKVQPRSPVKNYNNDLSQNRISHILEQNTKFLVKTIKEFSEKIENLQREISQMKNKMNYNSLPTVRELVSNNVPPPVDQSKVEQVQVNQVREQVKEQPKAVQVEKKNEKVPDNHPRLGRYNDVDVSIEKFFYMGSK